LGNTDESVLFDDLSLGTEEVDESMLFDDLPLGPEEVEYDFKELFPLLALSDPEYDPLPYSAA
jgi:hypothetical protein